MQIHDIQDRVVGFFLSKLDLGQGLAFELEVSGSYQPVLISMLLSFR
jgi:hypothetical protein